jgi:hypothetical protein
VVRLVTQQFQFYTSHCRCLSAIHQNLYDKRLSGGATSEAPRALPNRFSSASLASIRLTDCGVETNLTPSRKQPGVAFWATVVVVVALVAYPLSFGPACWWFARESNLFSHSWERPPRVDPRLYWPIGWLAQRGPKPLGDAIWWYATIADERISVPTAPKGSETYGAVERMAEVLTYGTPEECADVRKSYVPRDYRQIYSLPARRIRNTGEELFSNSLNGICENLCNLRIFSSSTDCADFHRFVLGRLSDLNLRAPV